MKKILIVTMIMFLILFTVGCNKKEEVTSNEQYGVISEIEGNKLLIIVNVDMNGKSSIWLSVDSVENFSVGEAVKFEVDGAEWLSNPSSGKAKYIEVIN